MASSFALIPAIPVTAGKAHTVDPSSGNSRPVELSLEQAATDWYNAGARRIQLLDSDAIKGAGSNSRPIAHLVRAVDGRIAVDVVSGISDDAGLRGIDHLAGANVVLSTAAAADPDFVQRATTAHPGQVLLRLVVGDGGHLIAPNTAADGLVVWDLLARLETTGLRELVVCDAEQHPHWWQGHFHLLKELLHRTQLPVIAGSGVAAAEDLHELNQLIPLGLVGAVAGRLFESVSYPEALAAVAARYDPYEWGPARP